jgi:hypothetical protein
LSIFGLEVTYFQSVVLLEGEDVHDE